ncbi:LacI family DNA-binding transcriptional regulator [Paludibaculum fermentans]|uniref:LacI family DNA-binding transcriptional regulator n=1 Tax=Paludibaculum fermentans TaxID=1473598 RepID=UPI003EBEA77C
MAVRLKDIARDLGVSVVTVSKVLRNHSDISDETRDRVLKRMKELNYRPNLAARALVTGRSFSVGLVVPDLVHPFFAEVAKGLSKILRKKGYSLLIASSEEDPELEQQELDMMLARRVDALVVASAQWTVESFRRIEEQKTPYVLIDRQFAGLAANFVGVDDEAVGALATSHLIEQGCRRIAHIRGPELSTGLGRLEGYRRALAKHGLAPMAGYVVMGRSVDNLSDTSGHEAMLRLLALKPRPDGVFCYNDPTAMGAMKAILDGGLRVPQDVAVIGAGNVNYAGLLRVPLSSIDQHSDSIGERAGKLALSLVESKTAVRPRTVLLDPGLVVRASSARAS